MTELFKVRSLSAHVSICTFAALFHALTAVTMFAQEIEAEKEQYQRWVAYYKRIADEYDFRLSSDRDKKLDKSSKSLMTYLIPEARVHGSFFVWKSKGRPEVIGAIYSGDPADNGVRLVLHEFHSLSLVPLEPIRVGSGRWRPEHGIELIEIPDAPPPSDSDKLRLAQMRTLARRFTGYSTPHGTELTLRTQSQPLYRYDSEVPEVLDGAVFATFAGWDPDIILLIEARTGKEETRWHYAIARFNAVPMRVEYQGDEIWHAGKVEMSDPTSTFYATVVEVRRENDVPEAGEE